MMFIQNEAGSVINFDNISNFRVDQSDEKQYEIIFIDIGGNYIIWNYVTEGERNHAYNIILDRIGSFKIRSENEIYK